MRMCQTGKMLRLIMLASLLSVFGCAQQMKSVQTEVSPEVSANGEIKGITVSEDTSKIDITSDRPIVYTYYLLESPPRVVVDLAQVTTGTLILPIDVNRGNVKRIDVSRHEFGSGVLSRVDISLADKAEVSAALDPHDNRHLTLNLSGTKTVQTPEIKEPERLSQVQPAEIAVAPAAKDVAIASEKPQPVDAAAEKTVEQARVEIKNESAEPAIQPTVSAPVPVQAAPEAVQSPGPKIEKTPGPRTLKDITKTEEGISIALSSDVDRFTSFKLTDPERLVVDIAKTRNGLSSKTVDINGFNLGKARIGGTPEKLRLVFDSAGGAIPNYLVSKADSGLIIYFGEAARKAAASVVKPAAEVAPEKTQAVAAVVEAEKIPAASAAAENRPDKAADASAEPVAQSMAAKPVEQNPVRVVPVIPAKAPAEKTTIPRTGTLDAIEFTQDEGMSRITLKTGGGCNVSEPVKAARGLYIAMKGCRLPVKLQRPLNTEGFTTVIKEIVPYAVKSKGGSETRIAVNLRGSAPNVLKRNGDLFVWEFREPVKPVKMTQPVKSIKPDTVAAMPDSAAAPKADAMESELAEAKAPQPKNRSDKDLEAAFSNEKLIQSTSKPRKQYTGRKVSLEFSDADVRKIFQLIAEVSNQNFLISDDVSGTISLKLVNVPWDQALDVILENKGLGMQKDGNIVQIRPKTKMKSLDDEAIEMRLTEEKKMPLSTVIFDINFATLSDIEMQFKNLKSKRADSSISSDVRTNKIIVVDIDPNIRKMRALLESLDVPEKQVMIEARIVEASSNFARDIGVKWNFGYQDGSASIANINNISTSMGGVVSNVLPTGTTGGIATGVSFGKLLSNIQLDMRLSAASTVGQVKIISTPKVLTVNNKAAKISQGQMIPYQNTSSTEGAKTEFIEAALSLEVTPHITADGSVNMKIRASNNSVGTGSPPPINKKEATTELVVKNGETTVIGGIYVDSETEGDTGVPYLSDIPLLGWLFKSNSKNKTKNELLIFITPKIVS